MDYLASMRAALAYIEAHLREEISMEDVAAVAGFSPYHFHRLFSSIIGDSLMAYIRKRRFAKATYDLIHTEQRILDIALEYGFESQESFTRSFKKKLGITPGRYRREGRHYAVYQSEPAAAHELPANQGGILVEANIVNKPEFYVIGLEIPAMSIACAEDMVKNNEQIPELWEQFNPRVGEIKNRTDLSTFYGVCIPADDAKFSYMAAVEVSSLEEVPDGMIGYTIPAQQYAVFTHRGPVWTIQDTMQQIYGSWLPQTGYEFAKAPDLEVYGEKFMGPANADSEMEICVAIK
ncbi:MAG: AraC family transcriptional regulator [Tumebacillaceae bacterium]